MATPQQALDQINARFGRHPGHRALHARGTLCRATFTATPEAAELSRAGHLQGQPVETTVRLSNGSGDPRHPDYASDVRGCAVKFYLPDGSRTDIVAQSAPRFPVTSLDGFLAFLRASNPAPAALWRFPLFLARNPVAALGLPANARALQPPSGYTTIPYFAIHAYRWVNAAGDERYVRYTWQPEHPEARLKPAEAKARGREYLRDDLLARIEAGSASFTLQVQVAEDGDDVDDPRSVWPGDRRTVTVGRLEVTGLDTVRERDGDVLVFDATRVVDGIELSDDPILAARSAVYRESVARRTS